MFKRTLLWQWVLTWKCLREGKVKVDQLCPILSDPLDCSLPGSSGHGILQVRILEWVAISFSRRPSQPRDWIWVSCISGWLLTIWATYNNNTTGTSAKLRSCWVIDAGHHPRSRCYYCPHFMHFGTVAHRGRASCPGSQGSSESVRSFRSQVCQIVVSTLLCRIHFPPQ